MRTPAKILIVDDKPENLVVLDKLLAPLGVDVYKASSGNEALALTLEHDFVLVLLDVQMPEMDGYEVLDMMSWDERTKYIPVIFITANYADEQHKLKAYQYGAVDYLYKPINEVILLSKVKVFLELNEQRLRFKELQTRFQLILSAAGEGVIELDINDRITYMNQAALNLLGRTEINVVGTSFIDLFAENELTHDSLKNIKKSSIYLKNNLYHKDDSKFIRADKSALPIEYSINAIKNEEDQPIGSVVVFNDITLRKTIEAQLTNLALYDHLTKLPNRFLFEKTINQTIARARRYQKMMALMFLDLDHFKNVNDNMGHDIGDLLLKSVAERLVGCIREADTVARLGGDEFAVILDKIVKPEDAVLVADKIITSLAPPFHLNGHEIFVSTSIGIALFPEAGGNSIDLTKNADIAMYQAKMAGRNSYQLFTQNMSSQVSHHLDVIQHLRYAIEKNEFRLCYQPKLRLEDNSIAGFEVLLRWSHPVLGELSPNEFIAIAEDTGYIDKLGAWVIQTACKTAKTWERTLNRQIPIAINIASAQVLNPRLIEVISTALKHHEISPTMFELEITETSFLTNAQIASEILLAVHHLGVKIAIDDFGTGYSSLNYLKKLPIDYLKIDKTFIADISKHANDAAIVRAVIVLAHTLGVMVIAEGVETQDQLNFLKQHHCDQVQGYLLSYPLAEDAVMDYIREHS